jgi:hypothetical protein
LICLPFLDTDVRAAVRIGDVELRARGYPGWLVRGLRWFAAIGLWYQLVDWEWGAIGIYDVALGYGAIVLVASLMLALLGQFLAAAVCLALAVLIFAAGFVGLGAKKTTR